MGCVQSQQECADSHPNVFRVTNINDSGTNLWSGELRLTETELILCRMGREDTVWPLPSLRRYGFDGDVFSFESGRRCPTGEGIYAFRCKRANILFTQLQNNIQLRNVIHESMQFNPPHTMGGSPSAVPRAALHASVVHRSSVDNGQSRNIFRNSIPGLSSQAGSSINQSPSSLSDEHIHENTPLYPRPHGNVTQVTNLYQVKEFRSREHNNNQSDQGTDVAHSYTNDNDLIRSLAKLRSELRESAARNNENSIEEEDSAFLQEVSSYPPNSPTSPAASVTSDHEQGRPYQNFRATEIAKREFLKCFDVPSTPLTPKQPEYCNFRPELSYANLNVKNMAEGVKSMRNNVFESTELTHKRTESDSNACMSPLDVNYAILDIGANKSSKVARNVSSVDNQSSSSSRHESTTSQCSGPQPGGARNLSTSSVDNAPTFSKSAAPGSIGYTTIDFDKTVALTSVVAVNEMEADETRRSRHDSAC